VMLAGNLRLHDELGDATLAWWARLKDSESFKAAKVRQKAT
jgi:hypothetical protein